MAESREFEEAKAFLQRDEGGTSVYDHLAEVLTKLLTERPNDALRQLEHISGLVKQGSVRAQGPGGAAGGQAEADERAAAARERVAEGLGLFKIPGEEDEVGEVGEGLQDLSDAASYLEWGGVSLGRREMFRLHLALKALSASVGAREVRFWGKVHGLEQDYIVAEGRVDGGDEDDEAETDALGNTPERTGEGANTFSYWVCNHVGGKWTKLPNVTPHQVIVARQIRRFLTGRLDASVGGHPPFPGTEASFLRAQIARISSETVVSPAGHFRRTEDEESREIEVTPADEYSQEDLAQLDGWVHHHLPLNRIGRTAPNPKAEEEEEAGGEDEPETTQPLKPISEDTEGEDPVWAIRACPVSGIPDAEPGLVVAKSLRWPGAVAVGYGRRFANCYVGYGVEASTAPYQPALPGPVQTEFSVAAFNPNAAEAVFAEQDDVREDPNAGKEGEGEGEGEEEEED